MKLPKPKKQTVAQVLLGKHIAELGLEVMAEYRFSDSRRWRFDLFLPAVRVGIEVDGGMFSGGHTRSIGLEKDYEKSNMAQVLGLKIMRFTNRQVLDGSAKIFLRDWLCPIGGSSNAS